MKTGIHSKIIFFTIVYSFTFSQYHEIKLKKTKKQPSRNAVYNALNLFYIT